MSLLNSINKAALSLDERYSFSELMFFVQQRRGELSLALDEAEAGLKIAKELNDPSSILHSMIAVGSALCQLDTSRTEEHHRNIIRFAKENGLEAQLAWAYHNLATYNWRKGKHQDAFLLYELETPLRRAEGPKALARHLGELASAQETVDPEAAIRSYAQFLEVASASSEVVSTDFLAEGNYRMAALQVKLGKPPSEYLPQAIASYEMYAKIPGMEARTAWAAGLVALAYESMGNEAEAERFQKIKSTFLQKYGDEKDLFRVKLSVAMESGSEDAVREVEKIATSSNDHRLYLDWNLAYSSVLLKTGEFQRAAQLNEYGLTIVETAKTRQQVENEISLYSTT